MKAIRIHQYGASDILKYEDVPVPEIKENELLVKVYAASVNHLEIKKASGAMKQMMPLEFPWIPGFDFAGTVIATGSNIIHLKAGDDVYGNCNGGSYAEYLAIKEDTVVKMPSSLSFLQAATVPHVGETAWQALYKHGKLKKGQKVLIHGAAGAVGAFAVQFAHEVGANIYATAAEKDREYLTALGTHVVIDYTTTDFTEVAKDMDLVIDLVGGETQHKSYLILKKGGRLVTTVGIQSPGEAEKYGVTAIPMVIEQSGKDLQKITDIINEKKIHTDVALSYPLSEAKTAWDIMLRKDPSLPAITHGKIVLSME